MNKFLFALVILAAPAFGSSLKCEVTRPTIFAGTTIERATVDSLEGKILVEGTEPLNIVPEPGFSQGRQFKYNVIGNWNWGENGLTVQGMSGEMTTGQHGTATLKLPGLKKPVSSPALRAWTGTLSLVPTTSTVKPRVATKVPVRCFFKK